MALANLDPVLLPPDGTRMRLATHEWALGAVDASGSLPPGALRPDRRPAPLALAGRRGGTRARTGDAHGHPSLAVGHRLVAGGPVSLAVHHGHLARCARRTVHRPAARRDAHGRRRRGRAPVPIAGPGFVPRRAVVVRGVPPRGGRARPESDRGPVPRRHLLGRPGRARRHDGDRGVGPTSLWTSPCGHRRPRRRSGRRPGPQDSGRRSSRRGRGASSGSTAHTSLALAAGAFVVVGPAGPDTATRGSAPGRGTR